MDKIGIAKVGDVWTVTIYSTLAGYWKKTFTSSTQLLRYLGLA